MKTNRWSIPIAIAIAACSPSALRADSCLLPLQAQDAAHREPEQVFPLRDTALFNSAKRLFRVAADGSLDRLADPVWSGDVVEVFDTKQGAFVLFRGGQGGLVRYTQTGGSEEILTAEERKRFRCLLDTAQGVFVVLEDELFRLPDNVAVVTSDGRPLIDPWLYASASRVFVQLDSKYLYEFIDGKLFPIREMEFNEIQQITETHQGIFLWDRDNVYRLGEDHRFQHIDAGSDVPSLYGIYEARDEVLFLAADGLFRYANGSMIRIPGDTGTIHSLHQYGDSLYVLASRGIFGMWQPGKLDRIGSPEMGVLSPGLMTMDGIFFLSGENRTYRIAEDGSATEVRIVPSGVDWVPSSFDGLWSAEIVSNGLDTFLATERAIFRFESGQGWVWIPSEDMGQDVEIRLAEATASDGLFCVDGGLAHDGRPWGATERSDNDAGRRLFALTENGVYQLIDAPLCAVMRASRELEFVMGRLTTAWNSIPYLLRLLLLVTPVPVTAWFLAKNDRGHFRRLRFHWWRLTNNPKARKQIFISYRQADVAETAVHLFEELSWRFHRRLVFLDSIQIQPGDKLSTVLEDAVKGCSVLLVLIGHRWLATVADDGSRRIDDPSDYHRNEIELALELGKLVIPVLIGDATMPGKDELPKSLKQLSDRFASTLRIKDAAYFEADIKELVDQIEKIGIFPPTKTSR